MSDEIQADGAHADAAHAGAAVDTPAPPEAVQTGRPMDRVDGPAKVCGLAPYAADFAAGRLAHATLVLSSIARGRVRGIDDAAARREPGVLAVITPANAPRLPDGGRAAVNPPAGRTLALLQDDQVHYDRQPIAVVVAETLESSRQAARLLVIDYEAATPDIDFERHRAEAREPTDSMQGQPPDSERGDVEGGWRSATHRIEAVYTTPIQHHNPIEMHATLAEWHGDGLTLHDSTQYVTGVKNAVAKTLGIDPATVRVVSPYVGGAFGSKGSTWSHVVLAAMAAREVGRPVRLALERPQMFGPVGNRPQTRQALRIASDAEGKLSATEHLSQSETAKIEDWTEPSAVQTRMLYACANGRTSHRIVGLDIAVPTFQRAPGEATGSFALESAMDELAEAAGVDPLAFRLRNHAETDEDKQLAFSSKSLRECYRQGAQAFGWDRRDPRPGSMRDGDELIGWGMATATYPARRSAAAARARWQADGCVRVQVATHDLGTGTYTVLTQVAADALGVPVERVRLELGDSSLPQAPVSGGSQTVASVSPAVQAACEAARAELVELAVSDPDSPLYQQPHERVVVREARLQSLDDDAAARRSEPVESLLKRHAGQTVEAQVQAQPGADFEQYSKHSFGAVFVEVRVDPELGTMRVPRIVGAYGVGRLLNAKTANSQLMGGIVWGVSMALHEASERDPRYGRIVNANLAEYHVPVNADIGDVRVIVVPEHDPHVNPLGAKGIGEIGITGVAAAIANAIHHATGRRVRRLPIRLDDLL
jgi:xanthine dehydrogenase YagR molybdenum-binding subunit